MPKNIIHMIMGILNHIPSESNRNKFVLVGTHFVDGESLVGRDLVQFHLLDLSRVDPIVEMLSRVETASVEWQDKETAGVLHLILKPAKSGTESQNDQQLGGLERTVRIKDLLRELTKDKNVGEHSKEEPVFEENEDDYEPEPQRGPTMER